MVQPKDLIEHYEKVRAAALGPNCGCTSHWGQAVLVSRGVAAWMQAAGQLLTPLLASPVAVSLAAATLPPLVRQDVVRVLSEVVLSVAQKTKLP